MPQQRPIRVLALDGGGIRGVIPATILMEIEAIAGKPIVELFDVIAGTSTGGLLASGLTIPGPNGGPRYTTLELRDFYTKNGTQIFSRSTAYEIESVDGMNGPKYPATGVDAFLMEKFFNVELKDAIKPLVMVSYDIGRRKVHTFHSVHAKRHPERNFHLRDAARATSAAPTFFPPAHIKNFKGTHFALIDGGVAANDPAMEAFMQAVELYPDREIVLVSLGTGNSVKPLPYEEVKDWGKVTWAVNILDIFFDGVTEATDAILRERLTPHASGQKSYYRFQPSLEGVGESLDNTDPKYLQALMKLATDLCEKQQAELNDLTECLLEA